MVCAPYEDDTAGQHAEPQADTQSHPFEVDSRSGAGEGAAVTALAAASRRRQAGMDHELARILAATGIKVPKGVAGDAQALLGTAGASDDDLILVLAVLEARAAASDAAGSERGKRTHSGAAASAETDDDTAVAVRLQAAELREAGATEAESTRESARIAATVRGTVFGRASMKGASPEEVDRLTVISITADDMAAARATGADSVPTADLPESVRARGRPSAACVVCCEDYEAGERVRVLPCLHRMHVRCIDPWLLIKAECPVCHESSRGRMDKDLVALVRGLSDAAAEGFQDHEERVRDLLAGFLPNGEAGVDGLFRRYFAAMDAAKR